MLLVNSDHLKDFPGLVSHIRSKGYGHDTGILKLRLNPKDRKDNENVDKIIELMKKKFKEKIYQEKQRVFSYIPDAQLVFRASVHDDVYQVVRGVCTDEERKKFVEEATNKASYINQDQSCCSQALTSGIDCIRKHYFDVIRESAQSNDQCEGTNNNGKKVSTVLYGSGIQLDRRQSLRVCDSLSMSKLGTVLDLIDEKYDGVAYPYVYSGTAHSIFPWHIEDASLWSINYLMKGASKLWFAIPPKYFGTVDKIASSSRIHKAHSSCRAVLVDHKCLLVDPELFKQKFGVPYITVVQKPGDFILTFPFALHSGGNMGNNLAVASNFGDPDWVEEAIYAPVCSCNLNQVHLDLTNVLKSCKPHLLDTYQNETFLIFPPGHPMELQDVKTTALATPHTSIKIVNRGSRGGMRSRTLECPDCSSTFTQNKLDRLKKHVKKNHSTDMLRLLRIIDAKYPPWKPKTTHGKMCNICGSFVRGSRFHLDRHKATCSVLPAQKQK
ncbi:lysine-specific demethylase 4A-like [Thrips palmi]|uniref:Lysine-specific demethylase 4A-like n=1 Tax=Thrips palmi TaxID=161013 RepID=A0A6P8ZZI0_THRPL|nr:lysine-specific demethylase 4A-like [Thrips palmi]